MGRPLYSRFYEFQNERFPILILLFTTLSVVLSSSVLVTDTFNLPTVLVATLTGLLFMFHIRVMDEHKDLEFDNKFHPTRPIQRGLIKLSELRSLNLIGIVAMLLINIAKPAAFIWLLSSLVYSFITRSKLINTSLRKYFLLYNFINLIQLLFLQVHVYVVINPNFSFTDPLLLIHFLFVLSNAAVIEIARKLKTKFTESKGKDTYSSRYGKVNASLMYFGIIITSLMLFVIMYNRISSGNFILTIALVITALVTVGINLYLISDRIRVQKLQEVKAIIFYLSMHWLLFIAGL